MTGVSPPGSPRPVTPQAILASRLEQLAWRLHADGGVRPALMDELRSLCALAGGLDPYLSRYSTPESADLRRLAERTRERDWNQHAGGSLEQEMLSGHVEGQLLKTLVHATRARRVLEIGLFTGYSALAMAEALPADGVVVACEIDAEVAAFAQRGFRAAAAGGRIEVRVGPAQGTLAALAAAGQRFDLIFIDADKGGYLGYLTAVLDGGLLAPHGLICVDNTLLQGEPWLPGEPRGSGAAIAAFNRAVAADSRIEQVIVPLRDGLTLIRLARSLSRSRLEGGAAVHKVVLSVVGVAVAGLPLADVDAERAVLLRRLLAEHGVLILPGQQQVDDAGFIAFLRRFGALAFTPGETPVAGFPDLNLISNVGRRTPPRSVFHVDTSYVRRPPAYTALRAVAIPAQGGETLFTNQYRAYETLPAPVRATLAGRTIRHVVTGLSPGPDDETEAEHPVFRRHPISGRTSLYLSTPERCVSISGMSDAQSRDKIAYLYAHSTAEANTYRHVWSPGDVVMWDNGCVLHRADHAGVSGDRILHRGLVSAYAR